MYGKTKKKPGKGMACGTALGTHCNSRQERRTLETGFHDDTV
jgi:hypothetical protein